MELIRSLSKRQEKALLLTSSVRTKVTTVREETITNDERKVVKAFRWCSKEDGGEDDASQESVYFIRNPKPHYRSPSCTVTASLIVIVHGRRNGIGCWRRSASAEHVLGEKRVAVGGG